MSKIKTGQQGQKLGVGGTAGANQPKGKTSDSSKLEAPNKLHSGVRVREGERVTTVDINANKRAAFKAGLRQRTTADGSEASNPKKQLTGLYRQES
jgi:hypothetical protein